jgi:hypothetical protein
MLLVIVLAGSPRQTRAEGLKWTIAPYAWASDVGLDILVNSDPLIGTNVPFNNLVDKLDGAFMGRVEMRADKFGAFIDAYAINLSDSSVIPVGPGGPIFGDLLINTDLTEKIYELGGFYRMGSPAPGSVSFDILLGGRKIDVDQSLNIILPGPGATPLNAEINISENDIFVGGRILGRFTERWAYRIRADYGGGGTDGTLNAMASVAYTFGKTGLFSLDLGYRYFNIELKDDSNGTVFETEITMSGPTLGFIFNF